MGISDVLSGTPLLVCVTLVNAGQSERISVLALMLTTLYSLNVVVWLRSGLLICLSSRVEPANRKLTYGRASSRVFSYHLISKCGFPRQTRPTSLESYRVALQ
jgi:hypothetical protein